MKGTRAKSPVSVTAVDKIGKNEAISQEEIANHQKHYNELSQKIQQQQIPLGQALDGLIEERQKFIDGIRKYPQLKDIVDGHHMTLLNEAAEERRVLGKNSSGPFAANLRYYDEVNKAINFYEEKGDSQVAEFYQGLKQDFFEDIKESPSLSKHIKILEEVRIYKSNIDILEKKHTQAQRDAKLQNAVEIDHQQNKNRINEQTDPVVSKVSESSVSKEQVDKAYIAYYDALDKLREQYSTEQNERKLYEVDAIIWSNKAKEAERRGNKVGAEEAKANAKISKEMAKKLLQEERRAKRIAAAPGEDQKYQEKIKGDHQKFLECLPKLELSSEQKKAKFVAHFLKKSAEMYIHHHNSADPNKENNPIGKQFETLLNVEGNEDLKEVSDKIKKDLSQYIAQMNKELGKKLNMHGLGNYERGNILNDSLYAVTAKTLDKIAEKTPKKEEEWLITKALNVIGLGQIAKNIYQKVANYYDKSQAIAAVKKLGISDAKAIVSQQALPNNNENNRTISHNK